MGRAAKLPVENQAVQKALFSWLEEETGKILHDLLRLKTTKIAKARDSSLVDNWHGSSQCYYKKQPNNMYTPSTSATKISC